MSKPIAFIIGAGKNVGAGTANAFRSKGYRIAQAARSVQASDSKDDTLLLPCDLATSEGIKSAFTSLRKSWGEPSVVVYNASSNTFPTDKREPFSISVEDFEKDSRINITSAYVAAQEAVASFKTLPASAAKAFLYTGNITNVTPLPGFAVQGVGKAAAANLIMSSALAYGDRGFKFHYVDERFADGAAVYGKIDGPAHGEFFASLADGTAKAPWYATFVKGQGYKDFSSKI